MRNGWAEPLLLAAALTLVNAAKPAAVDDTAYLFFARHIAEVPTDPYGFDLFWYAAPEPAMDILLPPVVPYWLSLGVRLFGDHLFLLKLWLFPFAAVLALGLASLLRRFAPGYARPALAMTVLGPAVLPTFGVMLDVPALGLALAAVACFVRGCSEWVGRSGRVFEARRFAGEDVGPRRLAPTYENWSWVLLAGVLAGLAMQTKYTALTVLPVIGWYGLLSRKGAATVVALGVAVGLFAGWEAFLHRTYGESHFVHHAANQGTVEATEPGLRAKLEAVAKEKAELFQPMLGHLGGLGVGAGLVAAGAVGVNRGVLVAGTVLGGLGVLAVAVVPAGDAVLVPRKLALPTAVFVTLGSAWGLAVLAAATRLLWRLPVAGRPRPRLARDDWFVVGWLFVELAGYFALTPFPAARRVIGLAVAGTLVAARLASLAGRAAPSHRPPTWVPGVAVAAGLGLFALDLWDSLPEKVLAERAAAAISAQEPGGPHRVWFNGHWGFQYYCDRLGMVPVVPGVSGVRAGDWLVFPAIPDAEGFYRPYHGGAKIDPDPAFLEKVAEFAWDDRLSAQTIPELYGGRTPFVGRAHPRLRVVVYRATRDWSP